MLCSNLTREQSISLYSEVLRAGDTESLRKLCREDLFFLIVIGFKRKDVNKDWLYARCREVEAAPDGHLDLWAREHYKSTVITYAKTIQDILNNPEITVGIFSHTRPIAKGFLDQLKRELESNTFLQNLFPEILYKNPKSESSCWSLDNGILVKRSTNPKEKTVEAWGLVDGQPTSKHFSLLVYDDVVTRESVTTPDQIKKVTDAWALSLNLGAHGGKRRYIGTRYHFNDTWRDIMERKAAVPRIHAATLDGKVDGKPAFLSKESLEEKRREQGSYVYACQMLQNPVADNAMGFKEEWLKFYDHQPKLPLCNTYILVDPASEKKDTNDYTVMTVIALAQDQNYYLIDGIRDRMNLTERTKKLFELVRKYRPLNVGYEKYGLQSDIEHIEYVMEQENYRFKITKLGGPIPKEDRIRKLVPLFESFRFWLPHKLFFVDYERQAKDFVRTFVQDEYLAFPVSVHDDMLDCIARVVDNDLAAKFPEPNNALVSETIPQDLGGRVRTDYDLWG
jgi:phage terminase large subunit-like protein